MTKNRLGSLALVVVPIVALVAGSRTIAQQPVCLHGPDESAAQQVRRLQALRTARQLNTAEAAVVARTLAYQPVETLPGGAPATPEGFAVHLAVDGKGYAFSIKDSADPCGFAFFSDQDGIIYSGEALR